MEKKSQHTRNNTFKILKVVLFGPESTGKTTLAKQLADHYQTSFSPEYMREFLQKKWDNEKQVVSKSDLIPIAKGQLKNEKFAIEKAVDIVFFDTNLLELKVYSEYYYDGYCPIEIQQWLAGNNYDFYLLTNTDTPWQADDLRDRPNDRLPMFRIFEVELLRNNFPFKIIKGTGTMRLEKAINAIDKMRREKNDVNR